MNYSRLLAVLVLLASLVCGNTPLVDFGSALPSILGPGQAWSSELSKEKSTSENEPAPRIISYPVTVENCGNILTFNKPPERVVTLFAPTTELMLALKLKDHIVAAAWTQGQAVLPEVEADYRNLHSISTASSPSREVLLSLKPDFVFDNQPAYFYSASNGFATRKELLAAGAQTYSLTANCGLDERGGSVETIYRDVRNIGMIFGVRERAEGLVKEMQQRIRSALEKVKGLGPVKVMVYIDGEGPLNVFGAKSSRYAVFRTLGVENVFPDLDYGPVSIEEAAVRDADVFVVSGSTFGGSSERRVAFLKAALPNSPAVKNGRVVVFPYSYMNPGIQTAWGVEALARLLYPGAFDQAAHRK